MMTSFPQIYAIFYYGSLERFQAFKVDRADVTSSNSILKRGRADTPPQIGFNRRAKRLVIETDTIHCTPTITNANINVVLWWQVITENPAKNFNIVNDAPRLERSKHKSPFTWIVAQTSIYIYTHTHRPLYLIEVCDSGNRYLQVVADLSLC